MLRIEKIFLQGFKSFCDPTEVVFDEEGVTAVVGPNGCGKCLEGDSLVTLADGRDVPIRELVEAAIDDSGAVETLDDGVLTRQNPHGVRILSLNPATLRLEPRPVSAFVKRQTTPYLLRIRTRSGREVTATPYHPLFTLEHGRLRALQAEEVKAGVRLALPRRLPVAGGAAELRLIEALGRFSSEDRVFVPASDLLREWADEARAKFGTFTEWAHAAGMPVTPLKGLREGQAIGAATLVKLAQAAQLQPLIDGHLKSKGTGSLQLPPSLTPELGRFLGLLVAEGRNTDANQVWFVNSDPAINDEYARLARHLFGLEVHRYQYQASAVDNLIYSHTLGKVLERLFNFPVDSNSAEKEVPRPLFQAGAEAQWAFLSGLFEGDAYVSARPQANGRRPMAYIEYVTASPKLARQVVALLLRLGVFALLRPKQKYASNTREQHCRTYYSVYIYGTEQLRHAAQRLSFVGEKRRALQALRELAPAANPNQDLIPGVTPVVTAAVRKAKVKLKAHRRSHPRLASYVEQRCEASRGGLLEIIAQIERLGATPEAAGDELNLLATLATSDLYWDDIISVEQVPPSTPWVYDLSIAETHNFVAGNIIVHNSNVADALSWVIGEQRPKALRGGKMEDVIFQGSRNRQPSGMAEVTLTMVVRETFEIRSAEAEQPEPAEAATAEQTEATEAAASSESRPVEMAESAPTAEGAQAPGQSQEGPLAPPDKPEKRRRHKPKSTSRVFQEGEQVTVARRLYRTGESEYEMNGRACRLRDIQDLFAGTGLGGAHYAIIEQGRIGQVLSAKPLDRRALIEEAAGISKFKLRQRAAELKLEASKQNLARLTDIITEIDRQQNSLKRQAARARRYKRLRQEMRDLMRAVYVADYRTTRDAIGSLEHQRGEVSERESQLLALIVNREAGQAEAAQQAREAEERLNEARQLAADANLEAERARQQHAYLSEQLQSLEVRTTQFERDRAAINERSDLIEQEATRLRAELHRLEQEINAEGAALASEESSHRSQLDQDAEAEQRLEAARQRVYQSATHLERWRQLKRQFADSVERNQTRLQGLAAERGRATSQAATAEQERVSLVAKLEESAQQQQAISRQFAEVESRLGAERGAGASATAALGSLHRDLTATEHRLKSLLELDERRAYFSEAVQTVMSRGRRMAEESLESGVWSLESALISRIPDSELQTPDSRLQTPDSRLQTPDPRLQTPDSRLQTPDSRLQTPDFHTLGTLADFVHVAPEHERMIEAGLRDELQYVLVPSFDDALRAIELLKTEGHGRATFLVVGLHGAESHSPLVNSDGAPEPSASGDYPSADGSGVDDAQGYDELNGHHQTLISLLGLRPEFEDAFKAALPALSAAIVVEDAVRAIESSINGPGKTTIYLTKNGERAMGGRIISGGSGAEKGTGVLALKREIADLSQRFDALSAEARLAEEELLAVQARIAELEGQRSSLDSELRLIEKQTAVQREQLQQCERDRERALTYLQVVEQETAQAESERAEFEDKLGHASAETEKAEREHAEAEQSVAEAQTALSELRRHAEDRSQELSRRRADFAAKAERRRGLQNDLRRLENEANDLHSRLNRTRLEALEANEQSSTIQETLADAAARLQEFTSRQESQDAALEQLTAALIESRERLNALDQELRSLRETLMQSREERSQLDIERARLAAGLDHIAESCRTELGEQIAEVCSKLDQANKATPENAELPIQTTTPEFRPTGVAGSEEEEGEAPGRYQSQAQVASADAEAAKAAEAEDELVFWQVPEDFDLAAAKARLDELRAKIEGLGPVNMMALDEIEQVEERYRFLVAQKADLEKAIADTQAAIAEIKRRSRERFRDAFHAINAHFAQMFQELFGGGHGEMRLIDETDILESGIDIIAQPPGKRLQNVLLLSGGEKAMAALALVLAIFKYRPSPFCLLDEVDAPLDEVNIGRFAGKVLEMSDHTQFMIITHSKRTMEVARTLYGVTMEDPGVSKLVSVRLT